MSRRPPGRLRIIGGQWRSRLLDFADDGAVRPTPDRVRQTLFDWLAPVVDGSGALDLFAGSGALGLEALSRGAARVDFIERNSAQIAALRASVARFEAGESADVFQSDAIRWLETTTQRYTLVFLDPPYDSPLLEAALPLLPRVLAPFNRVYLEWSRAQPPTLPASFRWLKTKTAGRVSYGLASWTPSQSESGEPS